jgi:hypothetical protein
MLHSVGSTCVRFPIPLVTALATLTLVACSGDDETAEPVPAAQRFVTEEDAPGSKPDPDETGETTASLGDFITGLSEFAINPDQEEATAVFEEAGFKGWGVEPRFFGETHTETAPHVVSSYIELGSDDGAASVLDWLETDSKKPCPMSCAVQISDFDVDDIEDARGVRRLATAEDIERVGTEDQVPSESYWVAFTDGGVVYIVDLHGPPGSVSEEQALEIARAYHDRLTGS